MPSFKDLAATAADRGLNPAAKKFGPIIILCLLTMAVYANSFPGAFIADDLDIVYRNPLVINPDISEIFTTDYWGRGINSGLYRPVTILSLAANRFILGPGIIGFHFVNVLLHLAVTLLVYSLFGGLGLKKPLPWLAAALFAVHPIHTEVVNEVIGRSELLAAFFILLGLRIATGRFRGHLVFTGLCYSAALLSKEHAVTFLVLLPLLDLFIAEDIPALLKKRRALYGLLLGLTVMWLAVRKYIAISSGVPPDVIYPSDNPLINLPLIPRYLTALKVHLLYMGKLFLPLHLQAVYVKSSVGIVESLFSGWGIAAVFSGGVFLTLAIIGWRKRTAYGLGLLFYATAFSVTGNLVFITPVLMAERYTYLPSVGFCLILASIFPAIREIKIQGRRSLAWGVVLGYLTLLGGLTIVRNVAFESPSQLWRADIRRDPANARAWFFLANAYREDGNIRKTEEAYLSAIAADPAFPETYYAYSSFLLKQGKYEEAIRYAEKKISLLPRGIGPEYLVLARAHLELGRYPEALSWLDKTGPLFKSHRIYWEIRGKVLDATGDEGGAINCYQRIVESSDDIDIPQRLAVLLMRAERFEEAERMLTRQLALRENPKIYNLLGVSLALQKKHRQSKEAFYKAMILDPSSQLYRANYDKASQEATGREKSP